MQSLLEAAELEPLCLSIGELRLYESTLGPDGGVYTIVRSAPLRCA